MSDRKVVDARGLSCPLPLLEVRKVLSNVSGGEVEVQVDIAAARDNVARYSKKNGWSVTVEELPDSDDYRLILKK